MEQKRKTSMITSQQEDPGFESSLGPFCMELICVGYSEYFQSKDIHRVWLTSYSKLDVGVNINMNGCLSHFVSL